MKTAFFSCMNDLVLSKNDELKYLILMIEEKFLIYGRNLILI